MATTKFYLDTRAVTKGKPAPLKIAISHKGKKALINLNVALLPSQWDARGGKILAHPQKAFLNTFVNNRKSALDMFILRLMEEGTMQGKSATDIKNAFLLTLSPQEEVEQGEMFMPRLQHYADDKKKRTQELYTATYRRIVAFLGEDEAARLRFEDITKEWLTSFETFLARTSPTKNARNIHLRNIRAVFNDAIDDDKITCYPFRRFKIRPVATAKRSLSVEELRMLFDYPCEEYAQKYVDMFKLIFFLIGINIVDLCALKEMVAGRVEYYRSKTGRFYSIKVEPEAAALIEKYKGEKQLLYMPDRFSETHDYMRRLNAALKNVGEVTIGKQGKKIRKPLFPHISSYWARHSWATIAASLDIPKETIAAALRVGLPRLVWFQSVTDCNAFLLPSECLL